MAIRYIKQNYEAKIAEYKKQGYKPLETGKEQAKNGWQKIGAWSKEIKGYERFKLFMKAFSLTILTLGFGLLAKSVRENWQEVMAHKKVRVILIPAEGTARTRTTATQALDLKPTDDQVQKVANFLSQKTGIFLRIEKGEEGKGIKCLGQVASNNKEEVFDRLLERLRDINTQIWFTTLTTTNNPHHVTVIISIEDSAIIALANSLEIA